ncbi:MAG: cell division protein FtsL [Pseudomonadota bacterium]
MGRLNVLLLVALVISAMYLVKTSYESRRLFAEADRLQNEQRRLDVEHQRLLTERQAEATNLRVERVAREKLRMQPATPAVTQYVEDGGVR